MPSRASDFAAALSAGIGSQVQKPLAVVVVTDMLVAPFVILVTLPVLISVFSRRSRLSREDDVRDSGRGPHNDGGDVQLSSGVVRFRRSS